jgi:hypothetical protein
MGEQQIPFGDDRKKSKSKSKSKGKGKGKSKSKSKFGGLSTPLRSGRDDKVWDGCASVEMTRWAGSSRDAIARLGLGFVA